MSPDQNQPPDDALQAHARPAPNWWLPVGAIALVLALAVGWGVWRWRASAQLTVLVQEIHTAIHANDLDSAQAKLAEAIAEAPDRSDVQWLTGRLAHARGQNDVAIKSLRAAWHLAVQERWPLADRSLVAQELADALVKSGDLDGALAVNDRALADLISLVDAYLDREDLGPAGLPRGEAGERPSAPEQRAIGLLRQRGRVAAARAGSLLHQGDRAAAMRVLKSAEQRISGTVCTGTHRAYCRGVRASVRDLATAPIGLMRVRDRIDRAMELVKVGRHEDALELAQEAREGADEAESDAPTGQGAARDAARVEYAVRVAWGAVLEKKKAWKDAQEQYGKAAALHARTGLKEVPHAAGLQRAEAVAGMLDETSSVIDTLGRLGLGDDKRRQFHQRIEADPINPRVYAEEALAQARAARLAGDSGEIRQLEKQAERYLDVGRAVAPGDNMASFYGGVTRFLAGYPREGLAAMIKAYQAGYRDRAAELYLGESLGLRGKPAKSADHWLRAWELRKTDTYVGRRAVEALLAAGRAAKAREVLTGLLEERTLDADLIEAQVMVHFHAGDHDKLRQVLAMDTWRFSAGTSDAVRRTRRIADAVYNKLGARVAGEVLSDGDEAVDRVYGYAVPADAQGLLSGRRLQSALLVLTTRRVVLLRWDAAQDYAKEIRSGVALARRAARLGAKLGGEWISLDLGDGIEKLGRLLDLLPEAHRRGDKDTLNESVDVVIESMALMDTLRQDLELKVQAANVRIQPIAHHSIVSYDLLPVRPQEGLYALYARTRDGRSPWQTDGDRLYIYTTRPARLRMYMDRYLLAKGAP